MDNFNELVKMLRVCGDSNNSCGNCPILEDGSCPHGEWEFAAEKYMLQAADAIEKLLQKTQQLEDKLSLAIGFWDSAEQAELIRKLSQFMPDISDPEWQKAHAEMGFVSPVADLYEELGVYDEPPETVYYPQVDGVTPTVVAPKEKT